MRDIETICVELEPEWGSIFESIIEEAERIFRECGAADDFCLQCCQGGTVLVFGGTNRVCWSASSGFSLQRGYCTERFITAFDQRR